MKRIVYALALLSGLLAAPALRATPISSCASNFSSCNIYEDDIVLSLPGIGISGDVVVMRGLAVLDVFRIFNDFVDTGGGTGLGRTAFLYAADLHNLPDPASYSVNAVTIPIGSTLVAGYIETTYVGNGTDYNIFTATPEPGTLGLLGLGGGLLLLRRKRIAQRNG
jgi:hypothetical protein